ncbi:MAG: virB10 [Sphingomonas bacterium]|uniref:TrbI/VirB10 family protein n=1 Tax=Sphingomonas bacterium TaxID=1895847 RepID=UPI00261CBAD6|nr:TrbI/VirB10 family protein [Sphingomonas bacterium]MDB5703204.1 virB10 [Sphingomonas bacterium]
MASSPPMNGGDPRVGPGGEETVRPVVALPPAGVPWWMFAIGIGLCAIILFSVLDLRRRSLTAPTTRPRFADNLGGAAPQPAPLYVPPEPVPVPVETPAPPPPPPPPQPVQQPRIIYVPQPMPPQPVQPVPLARARTTADPALVVDTTTGDGGGPAVAGDADAAAAGAAGAGGGAAVATRARASVMRHRATTVPQGTLIPAVLETALDSTRPGLARALVQRDVRGFDGSTVLIQRGSRLIGEYRADLQPGQNRATVMWTRLVRPDGVTIALGSPAADPLGRVGIKGRVNSHFFERFGSAILQSTLDVGVNLASRIGNSNSAVIVALPGLAQSTSAPLTSGSQIQPTLKVRQGTAITVFVARDLDFTSVEAKK